ncbi:MAG TPA: hypothetical protein PLC54_05515, partial [Spirochaetales bacterium]|nr:hypothetical protein [Spirochaetales bacterium]
MNRYASIVCLCAGILIPRPASALDIDLGAQFGLGGDGSNPVWVGLNAGVNYESGGFAFDWLLHADSSGQFQSPFHGDYFGDFDVQIAHGFFSYASDPFSLVLGAKPSFDVVASPYSLFMSGRGLSIPGFAFSYQDERFLFREQWMLLGKDSDYGWPDRSAVIKTYGMKLGGLRFGFQDSSVASGTAFDPLDVLIPAPSFLIQYVALAPGRPWSVDSSALGTNKNCIMGFFADYWADSWYAYAQLLVDNFNMNRFFKPDGPFNPDKLAFSAGGHYDLSG